MVTVAATDPSLMRIGLMTIFFTVAAPFKLCAAGAPETASEIDPSSGFQATNAHRRG